MACADKRSVNLRTLATVVVLSVSTHGVAMAQGGKAPAPDQHQVVAPPRRPAQPKMTPEQRRAAKLENSALWGKQNLRHAYKAELSPEDPGKAGVTRVNLTAKNPFVRWFSKSATAEVDVSNRTLLVDPKSVNAQGGPVREAGIKAWNSDSAVAIRESKFIKMAATMAAGAGAMELGRRLNLPPEMVSAAAGAGAMSLLAAVSVKGARAKGMRQGQDETLAAVADKMIDGAIDAAAQQPHAAPAARAPQPRAMELAADQPALQAAPPPAAAPRPLSPAERKALHGKIVADLRVAIAQE
jgi:hypothetical protein